MYATFWALVPPLIAIILALITKEVYSSLFIGIIVGSLFYANFSFTGTLEHIFQDGLISQLSDPYNVGILIFLVFLGIMVSLMNRAGGSAAFGKWASMHVKGRVGVQLATFLLGCLIFVDDYFNCLTVGSVMRPVTDQQKISRAKLAYLIDATAAPICIIAPISSWAAAVSGFAPEGTNGLLLFIKAIPYNFYALLTIFMMICLTLTQTDFGPMKKYEEMAKNGNVTGDESSNVREDIVVGKGKVIDLVLPIVVLIISCVLSMIYTGGFFDGESFVDAFANSDASVGLAVGAFLGLALTMIFYLVRRVLPFEDCMACITDGFRAMVPAMTILALAWTLKGVTDSLGAAEYVAGLIDGSAGNFANFLPAIIFVIAIFLAFSTGTSWGTFGILIPITLKIFSLEAGDPMAIICVSACMAGAVCGDHCSPISDTTIMSSAGAQCNHMTHVSTQLPYAMTVAATSFISYVIAGFTKTPWIGMVFGIVMLCIIVLTFKKRGSKEQVS